MHSFFIFTIIERSETFSQLWCHDFDVEIRFADLMLDFDSDLHVLSRNRPDTRLTIDEDCPYFLSKGQDGQEDPPSVQSSSLKLEVMR
jgi:hypothetical protein